MELIRRFFASLRFAQNDSLLDHKIACHSERSEESPEISQTLLIKSE